MHYEKISSSDVLAIQELSKLATEIVKQHFDAIIGAEQNDYMIRKFQSVFAIIEQLKNGYAYYFVNDGSGDRAGFIAFCARKNELYLSKFYLKKAQRGKGIAKDMLRFIIEQARKAGLFSIVLNVNKNNNAILAYEKMGFKKIREEKIDIGNGYIMDDFVYEYVIE
ncbi:MAG: GNAT family N-acetyltransferase [Christensenellales bacterium]|jgi:ribosomal protein S18 acetylase RimI-like enzyme